MNPSGEVTLTLSPEREQFVREEARRGAFASSGEYVRDLAPERFLKARDCAAKLEVLDAALERGIADADAGRVMPLGDAFARLRADLGLPEATND
jgi:antitoxin ParD1/3/4